VRCRNHEKDPLIERARGLIKRGKIRKKGKVTRNEKVASLKHFDPTLLVNRPLYDTGGGRHRTRKRDKGTLKKD